MFQLLYYANSTDDRNRVRLHGMPDYINASRIRLNDEIFYIATQAPMKNTINDFWNMVWEQNIEVIVMLLQLSEIEDVQRKLNFQQLRKAYTILPLSGLFRVVTSLLLLKERKI